MPPTPADFDVVIVGAGLAGASLAVALRAARLRVAVLEGRPPEPAAAGWDSRIYAISPGNVRFLDAIGAWRHLDAARMCPVGDMEIRGDRDARLDFSAYECGIAELAWIIESGLMARELWETLKRQANVSLLCPARPVELAVGVERARLGLDDGRQLTARLVVGADGVNSWVRGAAGIGERMHPYGEQGVVANFACERPHHGRALQWFRDDGVLAWLPLPGNRFSMVWSTPDEHARELVALPGAELCERVAQAGQHRLGALEPITPAAGFPLRLMRVQRVVAPRIALIGDAAHAIHPLSGHGINLGFKDAEVLAGVLRDLPQHLDCGEELQLRRYARARAEEVLALQTVTDALQKLFRPRNEALSVLRNFGLNLTNRLPVVRQVLVRYAIG